MKSSPDTQPSHFPPGTVLRPKAVGAHAFVIIGLTLDQRHVLATAWTSLDDECPDDECILGPGDHEEIDRPSALALSRARLWDAGKLKQAVEAGLFYITKALAIGTMERILPAVRRSRNLRREWKALLPPDPP